MRKRNNFKDVISLNSSARMTFLLIKNFILSNICYNDNATYKVTIRFIHFFSEKYRLTPPTYPDRVAFF